MMYVLRFPSWAESTDTLLPSGLHRGCKSHRVGPSNLNGEKKFPERTERSLSTLYSHNDRARVRSG